MRFRTKHYNHQMKRRCSVYTFLLSIYAFSFVLHGEQNYNNNNIIIIITINIPMSYIHITLLLLAFVYSTIYFIHGHHIIGTLLPPPGITKSLPL